MIGGFACTDILAHKVFCNYHLEVLLDGVLVVQTDQQRGPTDEDSSRWVFPGDWVLPGLDTH